MDWLPTRIVFAVSDAVTDWLIAVIVLAFLLARGESFVRGAGRDELQTDDPLPTTWTTGSRRRVSV